MKDKRQILNDVNRVFDTPIEIQEKKTIQDDDGIQKSTWVKKYKLFAEAKNVHGKEYEIARQTNEQKSVKFVVKSGVILDTSMRVKFLGKIYDIEHIDNIGYKNELLEIRAIERSLIK